MATTTKKKTTKKAAPKKKAVKKAGAAKSAGTKSGTKSGTKKATAAKATKAKTAKATGTKAVTAKRASRKRELPPAKKGSLREAGERYIALLPALGQAPATVGSYTGDVRLAVDVLGADKALRSIKAAEVEKLLASKRFNFKRDGVTKKADHSLRKSRRAILKFFEWCEQEGLVKKAPVPTEA